MTEEQFTDEQGNIVTKKVGAQSHPELKRRGRGEVDGAGLISQLLAAALTEGRQGSEETVQVPEALVF